mgnify:CR=1 FL=1
MRFQFDLEDIAQELMFINGKFFFEAKDCIFIIDIKEIDKFLDEIEKYEYNISLQVEILNLILELAKKSELKDLVFDLVDDDDSQLSKLFFETLLIKCYNDVVKYFDMIPAS